MAKRRASGTWVITGAASGFGRELARQLAARGDRVAVWDRDADALRDAADALGAAHREVVDVTDAAAVRAAAERTRAAAGPIAHAVHSAGILRVGPAAEMATADFRAMMEVNYFGSVHVMQALLPDLRQAGTPDAPATLLFIASVAGLRGFPELAGYSATKFAVLGLAQALRDELAGSGVDVRALCPPAGDTPMVRNLPRRPPIYKLSPLVSAERVVTAALRALDGRDWLILIDARSKALWHVNRAAPAVVDRIVRAVT
jgi:short-subunit dehydrogenase